MRQTIAAAFEVTDVELTSRSRLQHIAHARQAACFIIRTLRPHLSYPCIALTVGLRDHSTVIYSQRVVGKRMLRDPEWAGRIQMLLALFGVRVSVVGHDSHVQVWRAMVRARILAQAAARQAAGDSEPDGEQENEFAAALDPARAFCAQCDRAVTRPEQARCKQRLCGLPHRTDQRAVAA
ncbi:MAG: helix-turn-helix domain-containing protein [Rhabdaerophilum sp.]